MTANNFKLSGQECQSSGVGKESEYRGHQGEGIQGSAGSQSTGVGKESYRGWQGVRIQESAGGESTGVGKELSTGVSRGSEYRGQQGV